VRRDLRFLGLVAAETDIQMGGKGFPNRRRFD